MRYALLWLVHNPAIFHLLIGLSLVSGLLVRVSSPFHYADAAVLDGA